MKLNFIQVNLSKAFEYLGKLIGKYPIYFIIVPVILSAIMGTGITRITFNRNYEYLYTSDRGRAAQNKKLMESFFPLNTSYFANQIRYLQKPLGPALFVLGKDECNVFEHERLKDLSILDQKIKNVTIMIDGKEIGYKEVCAIVYDRCSENPIIEIKSHYEDLTRRRFKIKYPAEINKLTFKAVPYAINLGGVQLDEEGYVKTVKAIRLAYLVDRSNPEKKEWIMSWMNEVILKLKTFHFNHIDILPVPSFTMNEEIEKFTHRLIPLMGVIISVVLIFSVITSMTDKWIRCKPWLGIAGCVSATLAIITSFGSSLYIGIDNNSTNVAIPFLILANLENGGKVKILSIYHL